MGGRGPQASRSSAPAPPVVSDAPLFGGEAMTRLVLPGPPCPAAIPAPVWNAVLAYQPAKALATDWLLIRPFVLDVMTRLAPQSWAQASEHVWLLAKYVGWAHAQGLPFDVEAMLTPEQVGYYTSSVLGGSPTAGDYHCRLARIGRAVTRRAPWETPTSTSYQRSLRPPYNRADVALFERLEARQPCEQTRRIFTATFRLAAGVGATPFEVEQVSADDLFHADNALWVRFRGEHARDVPVTVRHASALAALAEQYPTGTLIGTNAAAKNSLQTALKRLRMDGAHGGLSPQRLRTTWLTERLATNLPIPDLLRLSGLTSTGFIGQLLEYLPDTTADLAARAVVSP